MKHIKLFNEGLDNGSVIEVTRAEHNDFANNKLEDFNKEEISILRDIVRKCDIVGVKNLFEDNKKSKEIHMVINKTTLCKVYYTSEKFRNRTSTSVNIYCHKYEDEWYTIMLGFNNRDGRLKYEFYRCDQLDGLQDVVNLLYKRLGL